MLKDLLTQSKVNSTIRDEYGLKAGGILVSFEKFSTLFGLIGYILFGTAEEMLKSLQCIKTLHFTRC